MVTDENDKVVAEARAGVWNTLPAPAGVCCGVLDALLRTGVDGAPRNSRALLFCCDSVSELGVVRVELLGVHDGKPKFMGATLCPETTLVPWKP